MTQECFRRVGHGIMFGVPWAVHLGIGVETGASINQHRHLNILQVFPTPPPALAGANPRISSTASPVLTATMRGDGMAPVDPRTTPTTVAAAGCGSSGSSRSELLQDLGRAALGAGVVSLAGTLGSPAPVFADNALAATKKSYFRYVPRIQVRKTSR